MESGRLVSERKAARRSWAISSAGRSRLACDHAGVAWMVQHSGVAGRPGLLFSRANQANEWAIGLAAEFADGAVLWTLAAW